METVTCALCIGAVFQHGAEAENPYTNEWVSVGTEAMVAERRNRNAGSRIRLADGTGAILPWDAVTTVNGTAVCPPHSIELLAREAWNG